MTTYPVILFYNDNGTTYVMDFNFPECVKPETVTLSNSNGEKKIFTVGKTNVQRGAKQDDIIITAPLSYIVENHHLQVEELTALGFHKESEPEISDDEVDLSASFDPVPRTGIDSKAEQSRNNKIY